MSNLGISHFVNIDPALPSEQWTRGTHYSIQLSWGELRGGDGYYGLIAALRGLREELEIQLSEIADQEAKDALEAKIAEIDALMTHHLNAMKLFADAAEAKAELALQAFLDSLTPQDNPLQEEDLATVYVELDADGDVLAEFSLGEFQQERSSLDDLIAAASAAEPGP
ncbi:hypothetical protein FHT80_002591 [Rhizobium sp. BK226]|uniref:hypothetical protein n=1 Tax=Rhizobium sp. BK226 TaxID=2587075 RepID=UPI0016071472|nr:hypothetical protein [Rhizobium sp. BK226]MBB4113269.1 hypothetical protein [Rhizobium sp. BK226]